MGMDIHFMQHALNMARKALSTGNVPVGALIVKDNQIISSGHDKKALDPTEHAEIIAIRSGCERLQSWNLTGCTLYVTLEPCPMCAGACVNSRISRVVFGAKNYKTGSGGTIFNILNDSRLNHMCEVSSGILGNECKAIIQEYFINRRTKQCCLHAR